MSEPADAPTARALAPTVDAASTDLDTILATVGLDAETVVAGHASTIVPPHSRPQTRDEEALGALPRFALGASEVRGGELALRDTIGEGGMGLIRLADQLPLAREVAVKSVRPERLGPESTLALLREARVTGGLEHPNIIPVHALGCDDAGAPLLVMKRVVGVAWTDILHRREASALPSGLDHLGRQLEILERVCNAVAFAHSRGIVHRDLKPDNVMVGAFGEVYVLDWGLAVGFGPDCPEHLPRASAVRTIAGTPHYMAPEMVVGDGTAIDARTDVYLLGAVLHEILTGRHRHRGHTLVEILAAARRSEPFDYAEEVPAELAELANRACHPAPEQRPADAADFRRELMRFVHHRHSIEVADRAAGRLEELGRLSAQDPGGAEPDDSRVRHLFDECCFGFRSALADWADNEDARAGLRQAHVARLRWECARGRLHEAEALLAEIDQPERELTTAVEELRGKDALGRAELARLQSLSRDMDLSVGSRSRSRFALLIALVYSSGPLMLLYLIDIGWMRMSHWINFLVTLDYTTLIIAAVWWTRGTLLQTEVNRRYARSLFTLAGALWLLVASGWLLAITPEQVLVIELLILAFFAGMLAATMERRLYVSALVYILAFAGGGLWPDLLCHFMAAGNLLACAAVAWMWRPARGEGGPKGPQGMPVKPQ